MVSEPSGKEMFVMGVGISVVWMAIMVVPAILLLKSTFDKLLAIFVAPAVVLFFSGLMGLVYLGLVVIPDWLKVRRMGRVEK